MAVTTLDPTTALIVIDLQKGIVGLPTAHPTATVVERSAALAAAFRQHGLPVVLVNVTGGAPGRVEQQRAGGTRAPDWAELVEALDVQPGDILITKRTWGAFHGTALHEELQSRGVTQVVLTGVSTSAGVESTARSAHEHGYNVTIAVDAVTDTNLEAHENSVRRIFPRLGETGTADEIVALLETTG